MSYSENVLWGPLLSGGGSWGAQGNPRMRTLLKKGEAEDAKDQLGGIPLSSEVATLSATSPRPSCLLSALIYLCNQMKRLSHPAGSFS